MRTTIVLMVHWNLLCAPLLPRAIDDGQEQALVH
jgi:hypothetical protein